MCDDISKLLQSNGLVVLNNIQFSPDEFISFASRYGSLESAWEDSHPDYSLLQLLDNKNQTPVSFKSTSKHWHTDRSFVYTPTRYTFLFAQEADGETNSTQFLDSADLALSVIEEWGESVLKMEACHSFSYIFPEIMEKKGKDNHYIKSKIDMYPDVIHPLFRKLDDKYYLYYNELCVKYIKDTNDSDGIISFINGLLEKHKVYDHAWKKGDLIIWDNFKVIHRASLGFRAGYRRLIRATIGSAKPVVFDTLPCPTETPAFRSVKTPRRNRLSFDRFLAR